MNKTLLLFIVDFLFLNLIALTRWEKAEPVRPQRPPVPAVAANAPTADQDLVATMRQSLADEQAVQAELAQKLARSDQTAASQQQGLSQLQSEKAKLATTLSERQREAAELSREVAAALEASSLVKQQLAQLQRELAEKLATDERQRKRIGDLEQERALSAKKIQGLTMAVVVGESEKAHLQEEAAQLKTQVEAERSDRLKVQASTAQLAQGVGQLAQKSGELTNEIRENRPINANVLYNDFLANRAETDFTAARAGLLGTVNRTKATPTVFITDGQQVYALLHIEDTVFSYRAPNYDWEKLGVSFSRPPDYRTTANALRFLAVDPRVVVVPLEAAQVAALGVKVYPLAKDPFKFAQAVLISAKGYGEVGFKLDPDHPGYVRVDNRLFKRIFGDFAPSRGDLVFSHTGELLGIMVNNDYCAVIKDFTPTVTLRTGDATAPEHTGEKLDRLARQVLAMPEAMQ